MRTMMMESTAGDELVVLDFGPDSSSLGSPQYDGGFDESFDHYQDIGDDQDWLDQVEAAKASLAEEDSFQ